MNVPFSCNSFIISDHFVETCVVHIYLLVFHYSTPQSIYKLTIMTRYLLIISYFKTMYSHFVIKIVKVVNILKIIKYKSYISTQHSR